MSRPKPLVLSVVMVATLVASAASVPLKGGLHITHYDGDALHLIDILARMALGQTPHTDFMTPIGGLAFLPIVAAAGLGLDLGLAFAVGQAVFAAVVAIAVYRVCHSRFPPAIGYLMAAVIMLLMTSLSHGDAGDLAVSMHYNRWAWSLAFCAILLAGLPDRGEPRPALDGVLIGLSFAALVLLKVTYFVAFAPAVSLILVLRRRALSLTAAIATGVIAAVVLWFVLGSDYWFAYLGDLQTVAGSDLRRAPGLPWADLIVSPGYLPGAAVTIAGAVLLRRAGRSAEAVCLLLLFPAFIYVTWQNFGNDPLWLIPVAAMLLTLRPDPDGKKDLLRRAIGVAAAGAAILAAPMVQTHGLSAARHLMLPVSSHVPVARAEDGIFMPRLPAQLVRGRQKLNTPGEPYDIVPDPQTSQTPLEFAGKPLPDCQIITGIPAAVATIAGDLPQDGLPVLVADIVGAHWLFGGTALPGGAPWNYGTLAGIEAAAYVAVPLCPVSVRVRRAVLADLEGLPAQLVAETVRLRLYRVDP